MKIYTIYGLTGEYSDRQEWTVKSFSDRDKAEEYKWHLIQYLITIGFKINEENTDYYIQDKFAYYPHPLDKDFYCSSGGPGIKYVIGEQELD